MTKLTPGCSWHESTILSEICSYAYETHCEHCEKGGCCDSCDTVEGRDIELVCEYASTCDLCGELTHHNELHADMKTQLGYCISCIPKLSDEIFKNLEEV